MEENKKLMNRNAIEIENEELEAAVLAMNEDKSQENLTRLLTALSKARVLVPAMLPKDLDRAVVEKLIRGEKFEEGQAPRMLPTMMKNAEGQMYAPAFTSAKQLPKDQNYQMILNVPMDEVIRISGEEKLDVKGIILNPATDKMILHPKFIDALKKFKEATKPREVKMSRAQFEAFSRKNVEWGILPKAAYTQKGDFMKKLDEEREKMIYSFYSQPYGEKIPCPYTEEDFSVMLMEIDPKTCVVASVELPDKGSVPQSALAMYIIWNPEKDMMHYYLIEKGAGQNPNVLTGINEKGKREELMTAPSSGSELVEILELIREEEEESNE